MGYLKKLLTFLVVVIVVFYFVLPVLFPSNDYEANLYAKLHGSYSKILSSDKRIKNKTPPRNIAIIGGGIGGSSTAYFLRKLFGDNVQLDLYESSGQLCGRVATTKFQGREYESGASIMHVKNYYLSNFREALGLDLAQRPHGTFSIFDGFEIEFQSSPSSLVTFINMIRMFSLDIIRLNILEADFLNNFINVYKILSRGHAFTDTEKLLSALDPRFIDSCKETANDTFHKNGIHDAILNKFATGGLRSNYGQDITTNGFVGLVSMAGIQPGLWSVKGGNKLLCSGLVSHSGTNVRWETVKQIYQQTPSRNDGQFVITTDKNTDSYDLVVLATPLQAHPPSIDISEVCNHNCQELLESLKEKKYRQTSATFVKGQLNSSLFKCNSIEECSTAIFTSNCSLHYRSIGLQVPVDFDPTTETINDVAIYKVFSTNPLTNEEIDHLFESHSHVEKVTWKAAYPYYKPPDPLNTFILNAGGLYYTSSIEWAASAAEMVVLSGKNVANLAYNRWYEITENIDSETPLKDILHKYAEKEDL